MADKVSTLMKDKDKVSLSEVDMFDRVINLKLFTSKGDTFVIRSDFEIFYPELMDSVSSNKIERFNGLKTGYIRKCQHKPSIKVQYKRVSMNTSITVDIFLTNFFAIDQQGNYVSSFNNATYPLTRIDFSMGYFGQFKALFSNKLPKSVKELFDVGFMNGQDYRDPSVGHGITVMSMSNVEYVQIDKLPPDHVIHIHGYVGNTFTPKYKYVPTPENFEKSYKEFMETSLDIPSQWVASTKGDTLLEKVFFDKVTRNYPNKNEEPKGLAKVPKGDNHYFTEADAKLWGIKVYLSQKAREKALSLDENKFYDLVKKKGKKEPVKVLKTIKTKDKPTAEEQMKAVLNFYGLEGFSFVLMDTFGDYIVFLTEEINDVNSLLHGTKVARIYENTALKRTWNNCIPAVYDISADALCTITCPFFSFINPFEVLYFDSRYALGGLVSYYANFTQANRNQFYALWQNVSFATVEDVNESMIVCTGQKRG